MMSFRKNIWYRVLCIAVIALHLATFGPVRDALAYQAESVSYTLATGALTQGGAGRESVSAEIAQDTIGEPCAAQSQSTSFILQSGFIATLQPLPPQKTHDIPNQYWDINTANSSAFDLDDYFTSPEGSALTYTCTRLNPDAKINCAIDAATHEVSFTQPQDYSGTEKVVFTATDIDGNTAQSNIVALQVKGAHNQPVIEQASLTPYPALPTQAITLTLRAKDVDGHALRFSSDVFFTGGLMTQDALDPTIWVATASWTPTDAYRGYYRATISVTEDGGTLYDSQSVDIMVQGDNHPPQITKINDKSVTPGTPVALTAKENDLFAFEVEVTDPDNNTTDLIFPSPFDKEGKWLIPYDTVTSGTATVMNLKVAVTDKLSITSQDVQLTVLNVNRPPQATLTLDRYTACKNDDILVTLQGLDADGDQMTLVVSKAGSEVARATAVASGSISKIVTFQDEGLYTITGEVSDGTDTVQVSKTVQITHIDANVNPLLGDFNGDGLTDIGVQSFNSGKWEVLSCAAGRGV